MTPRALPAAPLLVCAAAKATPLWCGRSIQSLDAKRKHHRGSVDALVSFRSNFARPRDCVSAPVPGWIHSFLPFFCRIFRIHLQVGRRSTFSSSSLASRWRPTGGVLAGIAPILLTRGPLWIRGSIAALYAIPCAYAAVFYCLVLNCSMFRQCLS